MIKANNSYFGVKFFNLYSQYRLKSHFKDIRFSGEYKNENFPLLVISNHFSWWDGFIQVVLNIKIFKRKFHVMMLEDQLERNIILNKGGAFSIQKNTRSIVDSLKYSIDLLTNNNNLLLIFPQGEIQSIYTQHFHFEKGLNYLLKNKKTNFQCVFNVNLIDYFSDNKPSLTIYFKTITIDSSTDIKSLEAEFNRYTEECKLKQKK